VTHVQRILNDIAQWEKQALVVIEEAKNELALREKMGKIQPIRWELIMGDKIENVQGSTIITRSIVQGSLNTIRASDNELAKASAPTR
jgi:hypothetical protein